MTSFVNRFVVVFVASVFIAGIFLSRRVIGISTGNYLLYSAVPFVLGLLIVSALFEKNAGVLAVFIVGAGLFGFLAIFDNTAIAGIRDTILALSVAGLGAGALVYFLQIKDRKR